LHAYLPGKFVDHTHSSAVLAVVDQPDGAERARAVWGDELLFLPYVMPGFALVRAIVEAGFLDASGKPKGSVLVLDKHGIFTWGETAKESYERMTTAVDAAERYLARALEKAGAAPSVEVTFDAETRKKKQRLISIVVRGALERREGGARFLSAWREEPEILTLLARKDAKEVTAIGTVTPDHVIRTKPIPMWLGAAKDAEDPDALTALVDAGLSDYAAFYEDYVARNARRVGGVTQLDALPRLLVVPGLGALCLGKTLDDLRIVGDLYVNTAKIIHHAASLGGYRPVGLPDLFDVEYWSLEQAKLKLKKKAAGPLVDQVALVTGAASGIGFSTAAEFLSRGAHVLMSDVNAEALEAQVDALRQKFGNRVAGHAADVTNEAQVNELVHAAVDHFGGLDIVVSNAGSAPSGALHTEEGDAAFKRSLELNLMSHQTLARAASNLFIRQRMGGCLLFNASKSAFNPGPNFGPYAVPKAAVVALMKQYAVDLGQYRIRANAINADRIRTGLFTDSLIESRAAARGLTVADYFKSNLLGRETTAEDVAEAFAYLAVAHATTGAVVTVDGGNAAAFPR
jgi:rhamnose utilization protein RhaD (predicted bifunctional aldolase and dehydrogenase)/NAD(P)-dependent dehydrogenase (short-subunit alcohol dehydrogenase family)